MKKTLYNFALQAIHSSALRVGLRFVWSNVPGLEGRAMDEMQASQEMSGAAMHAMAAMENGHHDRDPYLVKSVVHASQILSAFHNGSEVLPLKEIVARCGLPKSMVFRLLYTMTTCHIVEKVDNNRYHLVTRPPDDMPAPAAPPAKKRRVSGVRRVPATDAAQNGLSSG